MGLHGLQLDCEVFYRRLIHKRRFFAGRKMEPVRPAGFERLDPVLRVADLGLDRR